MSTTKFYQQDIVQKVAGTRSDSYGIVLRCWHDADDDHHPSAAIMDPLLRSLNRGEVGVSFLTEGGNREILPESELVLVDRLMQPGDICKKSVDDLRSGIVTDVSVRAILEHAVSREQIPGWWAASDLDFEIKQAEVGEYVTYENWIGQIIEIFDENVVEVSNGQLVRLPELGSRLAIGEKGSDILPPSGVNLLATVGFLLGNSRPGQLDTVVMVEHTVYAVAWLALDQSLDPAESQHRSRPKRLWYGADVSKLTLIRTRSDFQLHVSDRVRLKNPSGQPVTKHGKLEENGGRLLHVQCFAVKETQTIVQVLWQDGTRETLKSTELIPHLNPDEYDCWPGDHVHWRSEGGSICGAVIQSVDARERTARILFSDTGTVDTVSVLELDTHGSSETDALFPQGAEGLGVRRGDFVFIHPEGSNNGCRNSKVPQIGELEMWVREIPTTADGRLTGWRAEMASVGSDLAKNRNPGQLDGQMNQTIASMTWCGEVTDVNIDGTAQVTHPDKSVMNYPLERLTRLYDGIQQLEDGVWTGDDDAEEDASAGHWLSMDGTQAWDLHMDEWEDSSDDDMDMDHEAMDVDEIDGVASLDPPALIPLPGSEESPESANDIPSEDELDDGPWKRFHVLPSAPVDHAFYSSIPAQPSKTFLSRITREYRILTSSLPESILVRAYEDRTDLLRCMIIGPAGTPYADCPYVIDWRLDSNFPHKAPIAHFHSWTNGNGRVNPNLYEEGKVCLSLLGTWDGDRNESWSASRSSLLQALVSIQSLVLVKEPWFCEPAYEKLRGTEEGIVNSRLYNERAFVLSRGFALRALTLPPIGLEEPIEYLYHTTGRLQKLLDDANSLISKSKATEISEEVDQDVAVPRLSAGGVLTLQKLLTRLQAQLKPPKIT
ncbi:hypothetical protein C8J56DRAFT_1041125 [Mycena floridula]|nr:hypothetical protein C8J56DRAFT_1041125 [Mycena floridula]